jgi:hypothetical protein
LGKGATIFRLLVLGEGPCCHVVLHYIAFFQLVPDRVCMVGAGHLVMLLKVINRLPRLVLEVALGDSNELLIRIISLLVIVALVTTSSKFDPLGSPRMSFS